MADLQAWFAPLLWIIGTITALVAFVRLCKPVWKIFTCPQEVGKHLEEVEERLNSRLDSIDGELKKATIRFDTVDRNMKKNDDATMVLLHDQIAQIYNKSIEQGFVSKEDYQRAEDLHAQDGESDYINGLMESLRTMFRKQPIENHG